MPKIRAIKISFSKWMKKQIAVPSFSELFCNNKEIIYETTNKHEGIYNAYC